MKRVHFAAAAALAAVVMFAPGVSRAESYDPQEHDNPIRIAVYPIHAIGKVAEVLVTRPIHWFVRQPTVRNLFDRPSNPRTDDYWGDVDYYQRARY